MLFVSNGKSVIFLRSQCLSTVGCTGFGKTKTINFSISAKWEINGYRCPILKHSSVADLICYLSWNRIIKTGANYLFHFKEHYSHN